MQSNQCLNFHQSLFQYQVILQANCEALIIITADKILIFFFSDKIRLEISCESSAKQMIHMKCQVLFPPEINKISFRISSAIIFAEHFRVNKPAAGTCRFVYLSVHCLQMKHSAKNGSFT